LRGALDNLILVGGLRQRFDQLGGVRPAHIMVVVVNAEVHREPAFSLSPAAPSLSRMISAVSGIQISSYNFETLELLRESLKTWADEIPPDAYGRRVQTYIPVVAFESIEDPAGRADFNALPTSFQLDDEAVDRLIAVGRRLLRGSPEFQRLMAMLQAEASQSPFEAATRAGGANNAASSSRASPRERP
jgi:NTE family protein